MLFLGFISDINETVMKRYALILFTLTIISLLACNRVKIDIPEITTGELEEHIDYLASDELQGRLPGTAGDLAAAEYIRDYLKNAGLRPVSGDGLQQFELVASVEPGENCSLLIDGEEFSEGTDFQPLSISSNGSLDAEVVFAGYGFMIDDGTILWNDYADLEISNKWVMILRADPEVDNSMSAFAAYSGDRDKAMTAKDLGAAGLILVSGELFDPRDQFEAPEKGEFPVGIPVIRVKRNVADRILSSAGKNVIELEKELNETRKPVSFPTGMSVNASSELIQQFLETRNVIMQLPGKDPRYAGQYVVIGGHFDHLGLGGPGSSSRAVDTVAVHYGADDNASGISSMLEVAERAAAEGSNARTLVFAAFAAEEMGLLGSKYMVDNLPFEADSVNAMINLDMVGRLKDNSSLQVGGIGTSPSFREVVTASTDTGVFALALSDEGYGPSDHSSFYGKDIPVLFISTGAHLDYHTPADSPDKINYKGLEDISNLVFDLAETFAAGGEKLVFTEAGPKAEVSRGMRRKGVTLGIMPDFAGNVTNGLRADFITPGKPAQLGGMQRGDIIKAINGMPVNNIQDYMFRLSKLNFGETINVEIERDGEKELLLIKL